MHEPIAKRQQFFRKIFWKFCDSITLFAMGTGRRVKTMLLTVILTGLILIMMEAVT